MRVLQSLHGVAESDEGTSNHCGCRVHKMTETAGADEAMDQDGTKSEQLTG
jgi:hypothetical protein